MTEETSVITSVPQESVVGVQREAVQRRIGLLCEKYGLSQAIGNVDKIGETTLGIIKEYGIPEAFLEDDINLALLIGSSQKLSESEDPLYRGRVKKFVERLVEPSVNRLGLDEGETGGWSVGLIQDDAALIKYAEAKIDPEATKAFKEKFGPNLERCIVVWDSQGYELQTKVLILTASGHEVKNMCGGVAFIMIPDVKEMTNKTTPKIVRIIIPSEIVTDKEDLVTHELFHVEDRFGYVRRGVNGRILESVDELYTEFVVGNFRGDPDRNNRNLSSYFRLKQFWHELSIVTGLDDRLLGDRIKLLEVIVRRFGFEGLTDFAMLNAHSQGPAFQFEVLYSDQERATMAMLVSMQKIEIRKSGDELNDDQVAKIADDLRRLAGYMRLMEDRVVSQSQRVSDMLPRIHSSSGKVQVNDRPKDGPRMASNVEVGEVLLSYAKALACAELRQLGELKIAGDGYDVLIDLLGKIPYDRRGADYDLETMITKDRRGKDDEDSLKRTVELLYWNLYQDYGTVDWVFGLNSPDTRPQILDGFTRWLDITTRFCLEQSDKRYIEWFVRGFFFGRSSSWELREFSLAYIHNNYPGIRAVIERTRQSFDPKKV